VNLSCHNRTVPIAALYFIWYNFGRVHETLKTTPAAQAGIAAHAWAVEEIAGLLETWEEMAA